MSEKKSSNYNRIFDVIIVSKDRPILLLNQIERVKEVIPYNQIIIVESSEKTSSFDSLYNNEDITLIHTPNAKLGYARQQGLSKASTPYVLWLDDDIIFDREWAEKIYNSIKKDDSLLSVSSNLVFSNNGPINKICKVRRGSGISVGCCIMNRETAVKCGGFNTDTHWGEDIEFYMRAKHEYGHDSIRDVQIDVHHPASTVEWLKRAWRNRIGIQYLIKYGEIGKFRLLLRKIFGLIVMPFYYAWAARDPLVFFYYFAYRFVDLLGHFGYLLGGVRYV